MGLLFDEHPLILSPTLAKELGNLNEAVFVQQLHYWLENKKQAGKNFFDGRYWVYNSVEEWLKQFPWLSSATLRRTIDSLVNKGFVIRGNFNRQKLDRTIWYTINYEKIMEIDKKAKEQKDEEARIALNNSQSETNNEVQKNLVGQGTVPFAQNEQMHLSKSANASAQNVQMQMIKMSKSICSKRANASAQNEQSNTIDYPLDYPETTTTETTGEGARPPVEVEDASVCSDKLSCPFTVSSVLDSYNVLCPSFPQAISMTPERRKLIFGLCEEGFTLPQIQEAFKKAEQSDFLTGRVKGADWNRFDFDWLIKPSSIVSLLEGKYDNVSAQAQKRISQNQALIDKAKQNLVDIKPLTAESVSDFDPFLKESLKRHNVYPVDISDKEASS